MTSAVSSIANSDLLTNYINSQAAASSGTAATSTSGTSSTTSGDITSMLNLDFSTYLKILTTQLQNQDPTDATDPNQFTQELVQMGGVDEQISTNNNLTKLLNQGTSNALATGVGYIGNYAQAATTNGDFSVQGGASEFGYTLGAAASSVTINISDANGNRVASFAGNGSSGANYVSWNGEDNDGNQLADGTYTFSIAATDSSGNTVTVSNPVALAKVTGVQSNTDGTLQLICGSLSLSSSDINAVFTAASLPNSAALTTASSSSGSSS